LLRTQIALWLQIENLQIYLLSDEKHAFLGESIYKQDRHWKLSYGIIYRVFLWIEGEDV